MIIRKLNSYDRYFCFQLEWWENQDRENAAAFIESLKNEIPGNRKRGMALRFFLGTDRLFCIHRSQWTIFSQLVKEYYNFRPKSPFKQGELF